MGLLMSDFQAICRCDGNVPLVYRGIFAPWSAIGNQLTLLVYLLDGQKVSAAPLFTDV